MCGMNHNTSTVVLPFGPREARMQRRSNQSDTRLRFCKTRMEQKSRSAWGGQQRRLIRWISSWLSTLCDGGGDKCKQVASPGPPPLRSRKYHQGAEGSSQGYHEKVQDNSFQEKRQKNKIKKRYSTCILFLYSRKNTGWIIEVVFICQAKILKAFKKWVVFWHTWQTTVCKRNKGW